MEIKYENYYIGLDLGKTFGYSVWKENKLLKSGEIKMEKANKPWEMADFIKREVEDITRKADFDNSGKLISKSIKLVVETGQGFMSKNS